MSKEVTKRQTTTTGIFVSSGDKEELSVSTTTSYVKRRNMRRDPTIALGRSFSVAPILTSPWSIQSEEGVSDDVLKFVKDQIEPWRLTFLSHSLFSGVDFGWAPFEIVYDTEDGKVVLSKLKPLLQDITTILVDGNGGFVGFKQDDEVVVSEDKSLLVSFRVEGTMWYGQPLLDNVIKAYDTWADANDGAKRYDKKLAGAHFVIYYPIGTCLNSSGATVENSAMATTILEALESAGSVIVPKTILEHVQDLNKDQMEPYAWKIEILEDKGGRQPTFVDRLKYLDVLKVRGMIMPERSMMEGSHGTLAEAAEHIDLALMNMDFTQLFLLEFMNYKIVNVLLEQNWGKEMVNRVWYIPTSLIDAKKNYLQKVYLALISKMTGLEGIEAIDMDSLKDLVGVPKSGKITQNLKQKEPAAEDKKE